MCENIEGQSQPCAGAREGVGGPLAPASRQLARIWTISGLLSENPSEIARLSRGQCNDMQKKPRKLW